jgi:hypothetical protein
MASTLVKDGQTVRASLGIPWGLLVGGVRTPNEKQDFFENMLADGFNSIGILCVFSIWQMG